MSSFKSQCEIIIDKPAHVVYDFVTTVSNWIGIHPACKGIEGDDGLDKEATVGLRFTETIDVRGWVFQCHWEVRKMVKDQYFEFIYNTIITYIFDPIGDNKTRFIRTMINCTNADATPEQKADFADTDMHTDYLNAVKARLEKS
ncbi:unnamed protein product [Penicillium crustosum]